MASSKATAAKPGIPTSKKTAWTDTRIRGLKKAGFYNVARNLYLRVNERGRYWIFRWRDRHSTYASGIAKLRDMGLGFYGKLPDELGLAEAKLEAAKWRAVVKEGGDPIEVRKAQRAGSSAPTFSECCEQYITIHAPSWSNPKHRQQWENTLRDYAESVIGPVPVDKIGDAEVLSVLEPIWVEKHETATRVRQRVEKVLAWAEAKGFRSAPNPARRDGPLAHSLPKVSKAKIVKHHASLPYAKLPGFVSALRDVDSVAARALEFVILTACRVGEVVPAKWDEFDFDSRIWTVPAERMGKTGKAHRVPLCDRALELLEQQQGIDEFVFPSPHDGKHISDASLLKLAKSIEKGVTVHGFRSTFKTWATEQTSFPHQVVEFCMAHTIRDKVEAAYLHSDLLPKRVPLMEQWQQFSDKKPGKATVTPIKAKEKS